MTVRIRAIEAHEVDRFRNELLRTFGIGSDPAEDAAAHFRELLPIDRTYAAFEGTTMVGTAGSFAFELSVPGGAVPMAGLTMVSVRATHRRRGIMRRMVEAHFADARAHGEPLSGLWASESPIYGRFGYGVAAEGHDLHFDARELEVGGPATDRVDLLDDDEAARLVPHFYDSARSLRPGLLSRDDAWWEHRRFFDPPSQREGATAKRRAVSRRDGEVTGYVVYRQRPSWSRMRASGTIQIVELIGVDPTAEASLWRYVSNIDLFPQVSWWNAPTDCVLPWLVSDRRQLQRHIIDTLWLRIDDVADALERRAYRADGRLCLAVHDPAEPGAPDTVVLEAEGGTARCTRSDARPDLRLDRATLGSIYLGGVAPSALARANRIDGAPEALETADRLFRWPIAPWCPEVF